MAKRTTVHLVDDVDGSNADETVTFGLDGVIYEIDLNDVNAKDLRENLAPYVASARRVSGRISGRISGGRRTSSSSSAPAPATPQPRQSREQNGPSQGDVRAWAVENGIHVNERGRIAKSVIEQYNAAHGL